MCIRDRLFIAASVERGAVADERIRIDSSRMVVVSNPSILDPDGLKVNHDFMMSSINWMLNREELIGVSSRPLVQHRLEMTPDQNRRIFWLVALVLPLATLMFGMFVWSLRRN